MVVSAAGLDHRWFVRDNDVPTGTVLLTGTGLVPADDFTLREGD